MLQSTHYALKLVEGSDIVNPLVIDRPNYETIDDTMYENESKSIGNATELKSGTIHALTRTKGNQRYFCFTATSNYDAGDTFTVDSVPVTALLPNGTALPDNAYVVNGTVLCSLIGTLLTVYTLGSAIADDSIRLGGELPEYYAKASDLAEVEATADAASTLSINNSNQIITINSNLSDITPIVISGSAPTYNDLVTTIATAVLAKGKNCIVFGTRIGAYEYQAICNYVSTTDCTMTIFTPERVIFAYYVNGVVTIYSVALSLYT